MANSVNDSGQKPYCIDDKIECSSMKDTTLIEMSFSNTSNTSEKRILDNSYLNYILHQIYV